MKHLGSGIEEPGNRSCLAAGAPCRTPAHVWSVLEELAPNLNVSCSVPPFHYNPVPPASWSIRLKGQFIGS